MGLWVYQWPGGGIFKWEGFQRFVGQPFASCLLGHRGGDAFLQFSLSAYFPVLPSLQPLGSFRREPGPSSCSACCQADHPPLAAFPLCLLCQKGCAGSLQAQPLPSLPSLATAARSPASSTVWSTHFREHRWRHFLGILVPTQCRGTVSFCCCCCFSPFRGMYVQLVVKQREQKRNDSQHHNTDITPK